MISTSPCALRATVCASPHATWNINTSLRQSSQSKQKHFWPASRSIIKLKKIEVNDTLKVEKEIQNKNFQSKEKGLKNIVITGVGGFIGKNLVENLMSHKNYHLIVISRSIKKFKNNNISIFYSELSELKES